MKERKNYLINDLTGNVYGELTVLSLSDTKGKWGSTAAFWNCECSCGTVIVVGSSELRNGVYKSCGCKRAENRDTGVRKHIENDKVNGTRKSALKAKLHANNSSGVKGVRFNMQRGKWTAHIGFQGKQISLGYYEKFEDAIEARKAGEEKYHKPILDGE